MRTSVAALCIFLVASLAPAQQQGQKAEPEAKAKEQAEKKAEKIDPAEVFQLWGGTRFQAVQAPQFQPVQVQWVRANGQPVQGQPFEWVRVQAQGQLGGFEVAWQLDTIPAAHVAKVPRAATALTEVEQALQAAKSAGDRDAVLRALDDLERAVMKTRAALHEHDAQEKK